MTNNSKSRYWTFVVYEESAPHNWIEIIKSTFLPIAFIYHDRDINDDGTIKKPHYHVFVQYGNTTTYKNIFELFGSICANGHIERVISPTGAYQYLTHKNRPEKTQYADDEIVWLNSFDPSTFAEWSPSEKMDNMRVIMLTVNSKKIYEYAGLLEYFADSPDTEMLKFCMFNTTLVNTYITSARHRLKKSNKE